MSIETKKRPICGPLSASLSQYVTFFRAVQMNIKLQMLNFGLYDTHSPLAASEAMIKDVTATHTIIMTNKNLQTKRTTAVL